MIGKMIIGYKALMTTGGLGLLPTIDVKPPEIKPLLKRPLLKIPEPNPRRRYNRNKFKTHRR